MSNANPTPATMRAAREIARELTDYFDAMQKAGRREGRLHYVGQLIAAALAEAERGALTEAAQVARNEMINPAFEWREHNLACDVIARAIEALREKP